MALPLRAYLCTGIFHLMMASHGARSAAHLQRSSSSHDDDQLQMVREPPVHFDIDRTARFFFNACCPRLEDADPAALFYNQSSGMLCSSLTDNVPFFIQWPGGTMKMPSYVSASLALRSYHASRLATHIKLDGSPSTAFDRSWLQPCADATPMPTRLTVNSQANHALTGHISHKVVRRKHAHAQNHSRTAYI